jgi:hypothetical protein
MFTALPGAARIESVCVAMSPYCYGYRVSRQG